MITEIYFKILKQRVAAKGGGGSSGSGSVVFLTVAGDVKHLESL